MDPFSYLSVLISIILGLGITQLLTGVGRLVQGRAGARVYWPSLAWAGVLLVAHVQAWWTMYGLRDHGEWNFFAFLIVLLQPILLYLLAALVLPGEGADLRANYFAQTRWFFGLFIVLLLVSLLKDLALEGALPDPLNFAAHLTFLALSAAGAVVRRERVHELLPAAALALLSAYILLLFVRLQ